MYNFKDPLLSHITDRSCIFQECPMYLPWDMTKGLSGYGENTKCMTGSSVLMSLLSPRPQILHYHLHSSQALWPANLDTMLQEPPQRFPGHRSAHGPRKTLWLMRLHSWVWRALLPPPAVSRCQWHWFSVLLCHSPTTENLTPSIFLKWHNATY